MYSGILYHLQLLLDGYSVKWLESWNLNHNWLDANSELELLFSCPCFTSNRNTSTVMYAHREIFCFQPLSHKPANWRPITL